MTLQHTSPHLRALTVTEKPVTSLIPASHNPRTHSKRQIRQLADSIQAFGFTSPILVDDAGMVIAGHGRILAAELLGMPTVPTICLSDMSEAQKRAYLIADNKLAENAGWDETLPAIELDYLTVLDVDFDLTLTGFEVAEIDLLIDQHRQGPEVANTVPTIDPAVPPVTQTGDLWLIGKHREFGMASGEMSKQEFTAFLLQVFRQLVAHSMNGSIHHICMDWRHLDEILTAGNTAYSELKNLCVWNKHNAGMGSLYRSKHELVFVFKSGTRTHLNNIELGKHGRYRTNVWDYDGVNTLHPTRREELTLHPTVKPIAMVADAIQDCSKRGDIILDCFSGSGTTLLAAQKTGRRGYGMELDPHYVDVTLLRLQEHFGLDAIHAESGHHFEALKRSQQKPKSTKKRTTRRKAKENSYDR